MVTQSVEINVKFMLMAINVSLDMAAFRADASRYTRGNGFISDWNDRN